MQVYFPTTSSMLGVRGSFTSMSPSRLAITHISTSNQAQFNGKTMQRHYELVSAPEDLLFSSRPKGWSEFSYRVELGVRLNKKIFKIFGEWFGSTHTFFQVSLYLHETYVQRDIG
jgi:hypothetical protein